MKKILIILLTSIVICACQTGNDSGSKADTDQPTLQDSVDTCKISDAELKTLYVVLRDSVQNQGVQIGSNTKAISIINDKLNDRVTYPIVYILLVVSVLLLILVIVALVSVHKLQNSREKLKGKIEHLESKMMMLEDRIYQASNGDIRSSYDCRDDIDVLKRQVRTLREKVEKSNVNVVEATKEIEKKVQPPIDDTKKVGYFGVNDGAIIGKEYASASDEAVFKYYSSKGDANVVEFVPIALKRIKSISSIKSAVEIDGSLQEANSMDVVKRGTAVQRQQNGQKYWEIIQKAKIKIK